MSSNPGLLKVDIGKAAIQKGSYKVTHLIDLQNFEITLDQIDGIAKDFDENSSFKNILESKITILKRAINNLTPKKRYKRSWEALGSGIKWIAGNADADDLRNIDEKFENHEEKLNDLVKRNNDQLEMNEIFQDKINEITSTIRDKILRKFNVTFTSLEIVNLMFNIDLAKEALENINEAIILSKLKVVSKNILEEKELKYIAVKLREQNLHFTSTTEMYSYLRSDVEYGENYIYYHVNIPQVENDFKKLFVEPITIQNKEIKTDYSEILIKDNRTYAVTNPCLEFSHITLCEPTALKDMSEDPCLPRLTRDSPGDCVFKEVSAKLTIRNIRSGYMIIKNAHPPVKIENTCGMPHHTLSGTILITFKNCSISINNETFENTEWKNKQRFELLPFFNISIKQRNIEPLVDLHELQDLHIKSRHRLSEIHTRSLNNEATATNVIIMIAIIISIIVGLIAFAYFKIYNSIKPVRDVLELAGEELREHQQEATTSKPFWK